MLKILPKNSGENEWLVAFSVRNGSHSDSTPNLRNSITTPMHTDRRKVICESQRLSAAGDWERYVA